MKLGNHNYESMVHDEENRKCMVQVAGEKCILSGDGAGCSANKEDGDESMEWQPWESTGGDRDQYGIQQQETKGVSAGNVDAERGAAGEGGEGEGSGDPVRDRAQRHARRGS